MLVFGYILVPCCPSRDNYTFILRLFKNMIVPGTLVTFPEILFADALTSITKTFKDIGVMLIVVYSRLSGADIVAQHDQCIVLITLLTAIPSV